MWEMNTMCHPVYMSVYICLCVRMCACVCASMCAAASIHILCRRLPLSIDLLLVENRAPCSGSKILVSPAIVWPPLVFLIVTVHIPGGCECGVPRSLCRREYIVHPTPSSACWAFRTADRRGCKLIHLSPTKAPVNHLFIPRSAAPFMFSSSTIHSTVDSLLFFFQVKLFKCYVLLLILVEIFCILVVFCLFVCFWKVENN